MKILNLYAGIGGNRKLWGNDHDITAVEINPDIAKIYQDFFPSDNVIVADAHQYLLDHYQEYDFIWSSPPCPTHSDIRRCGVHNKQYKAKYPDMKLYEEIILLSEFHNRYYCIENVIPYYKPLINAYEVDRHLIWSNFHVSEFIKKEHRIHNNINGSSTIYGYNINKYNISEKRKILRNLVDPELGKHILDCCIRDDKGLFNEL